MKEISGCLSFSKIIMDIESTKIFRSSNTSIPLVKYYEYKIIKKIFFYDCIIML